MSTIGKSVGLATAFLAGIVIAENAGPLSRAGAGASAPIANPPSSSTSGPYSRSGVGPRVSSFETVRTEHYQVPEDSGANIALDPYKRGVSARPGD
jgi:hypothetical protein